MGQGLAQRHAGDRLIATSLMRLVLAAVLPVVVFAAGVSWAFVDQHEAAAKAQLGGITRALAVAVDRELERQLAAMKVLAASDSLDDGDLDRFHRLASRAMAAHPSWLDIGLIEPVGKTLVSTQLVLPDQPMPSIAPDAIEAVVRSGQPRVVGAFPPAKVVQRPSVRLMAPVVRDGRLRYVMVAVVDPAVFSVLFAEQGLPESWTGAVIDGEMRLAGRSRTPDSFIGTPIAASVAEHVGNSEPFLSATREGVVNFSLVSRSAFSGWSVVVGVPEEEYEQPIRRAKAVVFTAAGVFVALALAAAALVGRAIVARRRAYEDALEAKARELEASEEQLRRSNADLEQFAYAVSHDLRAPLRTVSSYLQLIGRRLEGALDPELGEFLEFAFNGARKMDRLIVDLLRFSRIGCDAQPMAAVGLADAVAEALHNLEPDIADAGAEISVPSRLPEVTGRAGELARLFQNLLGNAVKYRDPARTPRISLACWQEGREWVVSVRDNGIGIPADQRERAFALFTRLHAGEGREGNGIGLALCRRIVEAHGGRIWVAPGEAPGCDIRFTLPV